MKKNKKIAAPPLVLVYIWWRKYCVLHKFTRLMEIAHLIEM
jgi:hypothetical protein